MRILNSKLFRFFSATLVICAIFYVLLIISGIIYIKPHGKIIDPSHPQFDNTKFRFQDYTGTSQVPYVEECEAVKKVLKKGLSKDIVKTVLIDSANSWILEEGESRIKYLSHNTYNSIALLVGSIIPVAYSGRVVEIQYDGFNKIEEVKCTYLFGSFDFNLIQSKLRR